MSIDDGRWQGLLEFRPASGVGAFGAAAAPLKVGPAGIAAAATPARSQDRLRHLEMIERDVLSFFTSRGTTRVPTQEIFDRGPHANADFVRAFEHLEKRHALLVRRTVDGGWN